jgi:serine protease Do
MKPDRPTSVEELKEIQAQVRAVTDKVIPVTVCLQVGSASGSGVIVSEDGLIMTAGHVVAGPPGRPLTVIMADGKRYHAKVLGLDQRVDSGMAILTDKPDDGGKWPYAEVAPSQDLKGGQWVIATGHPGGYKVGRPPVVRVGRIVTPRFPQKEFEQGELKDTGVTFIQTDCPLVGGDSGGPLFDMHGRVIGIHSRIGPSINQNLVVASDRYREAWDTLQTENIQNPKLFLGVTLEVGADKCKITKVSGSSPAARAGLKVGDVITRLGGREIGTYDEFLRVLAEQKPFVEVPIEVKRGDEIKEFKVEITIKTE